MPTVNKKHNIDVQIEDTITFDGSDELRTAALAVLYSHELEDDMEVVVVVSNDEALRDLNCRFRGVDEPTDVLSFANDNRGPYAGFASSYSQYLGDVVISIDRAIAQAGTVQADLTEEMQLLVVHGTLHLLGYDHEEEDDKSKMWAAQSQILKLLHIDIPLPE